MRNRFRKGVGAALAAAAIAVPVMPAAPAAAQDYDCEMHAPFDPVEEAIECVRYILITAIDWPPR